MNFPSRFRVALIFLVGLASSVRAADAPTAAGVAYFEQHIRPLLAENCYSCHSREKKQKAGLVLDSRAGWVEGGDQGSPIVPGDPDASLLIKAVRYTDPDLKMPPDEKSLSAEQIARLETWVKMGAPDPRAGPAFEKSLSPHASDPIAGRTHWAYRPLAAAPPPKVKSSRWPKSPIDNFILAKLEAAKLRPAEDADRRTLLRRVFFQLAGLPPTPAQVAAFLEDKRPDAYARVVDQLMASPQFGERWGRHWLDLARYADSNGLDENFLFREAWRYRNWVIDAVNADLPFDRFLTEQLAGDLLPYDSIAQRDRQRIAAGFLVVGPKILLSDDKEQKKMDVADELVDTVGRAVLGQTLGCARCHDHKFDPIPTSDYYALAGIFTSTQVVQTRHMLGQQRQMERLVGLNAEGDELNSAYEKYWKENAKARARERQAKLALDHLAADDEKKLADLVEKDKKDKDNAIAPVAADPAQPKADRVAAQKELFAKIQAITAGAPKIPPRAMIPADAEKPADEAIRLSGHPDRQGKKVPRGFLRVLGDAPAAIPEDHSGRLELARWLTDTKDGAGHLAARVLANRVWHYLFGRGLVRTTDNFGRTGELPSHPELLDHLARRLIDSGWSIKSLVREIVLTRTFVMSSRDHAAASALDPDNTLLWRAPRRRLEPEALRDAMLAVAGKLDLKPLDSTVAYLGDQATGVGKNENRRRTDFPNRSLYLPVIRNDLPELFDVFDFTNPQASTGARTETMVATQGLFMLNDPSVTAAAEALARRLSVENWLAGPREMIDLLFQLSLGAPPTEGERADLLAFIERQKSRLASGDGKDPNLQAWSLACQALFASSRFQTLD
ncbi:MAG: hypothetical protein RLZZ15_2243 [Verrucomicrobiota bacterium]